MASQTLEAFLKSSNLTQTDWETSGADWDELQTIATDYRARHQELCHAAEFVAGQIRTFDGVHSVRWRVKDTDHVLAKIVRKKIEKVEKYARTTVENYADVITDLIGVRALHLFKHDCIDIDAAIRKVWNIQESVIYTREGDSVPEELITAGGVPEKHGAGYRSVHYIIESQPALKRIFIEVQVRTLFEEGWSEIDHTVRYPNFSDDPMISLFLNTFNRLAGSADEMGTFVKNLGQVLSAYKAERESLTSERNRALEEMTNVVAQLENMRNDHEESRQLISKLKGELYMMKKSSSREGLGIGRLAQLDFEKKFGVTLSEALRRSPALGISPVTLSTTVFPDKES